MKRRRIEGGWKWWSQRKGQREKDGRTIDLDRGPD